MKTITARIKDKHFKDLKKIEIEEQADKAEIIRKLLAKSIHEWKKEKALEMLKKHKVTMRGAAKFVGVSYVEMMDLASKEDIDIGYSLDDLQKDLEI